MLYEPVGPLLVGEAVLVWFVECPAAAAGASDDPVVEALAWIHDGEGVSSLSFIGRSSSIGGVDN